MALPGDSLEWLFGELAHAVAHGKALPEALSELARAEGGSRRGLAAGRLAEALARGETLAGAVAADPQTYPPGVAAALEAGEKGGRLAEVLTTLCDHARMDGALRYSLSRALIYPLIISIGATVSLLFIHARIVPMFRRMFEELCIELPALTQLTLSGGALVLATLLVIGPAAVLAGLYLISWDSFGRFDFLDAARLRLPVVGRPVRRILLARWCATAGALFAAGVPEARAVRLAGESTGNLAVNRASAEIAAGLEAGVPLSQAMAAQSFFPPLLSWMVGASDRAGGHGDLWALAQETYSDQARVETTIMTMIVGVFFVFVMLQLVALTVLSMFQPLIKLMNSLGG